MNEPTTPASLVAALTAGWLAQGTVAEADLAEARRVLEQTLRSGLQIGAAATLPAIDALALERAATPDSAGAAGHAWLRSLPASEGLARALPAWAHGVAASRSLGPFVDAVGAPRWVDIVTAVRKTFTVLRGSTTLCLLQLEVPVLTPVPPVPAAEPALPIVPVVHGTLGPGSIWLAAAAFDASAGTDTFAGLAFTKGRVTISGAFTSSGNEITLSPSATLTIELAPLAAPVPAAGHGGGADFRSMALALPASIGLRFAPGGNALGAMADASLGVFGSNTSFTHGTGAPAYNAALALLAFPCQVAPALFGVASSQSPIFTLAGSATLLGGAYALPVVTTSSPTSLGPAAAGGYLSLVMAGPLAVTLAAATAPTPLAGAVLLATPSTLIVFVQNVVASVQRYDLWDGTAARPSSLLADVAAGSTLTFVASAASEFTLEDAAIEALLDRPVVATGAMLPVHFALALVAVVLSHKPASLLVIAFQPTGKLRLPLVLDNAWLRVAPPTGFELFGRLQGSRVVRGELAVAMPLERLLPTLPDPYLARYSGGAQPGVADGASDAVAIVQWATPSTPRLMFTLLPVQAATGAASAAPPVLADTLVGAARGNLQGLAELLDVSTNADLLGVFIYENAGALGFEGTSLVAQLDQLLLIAVPQVSWEPLLTPGANWGFVSPADGTAAAVFVQSAQPIRVAPSLLFDVDANGAAKKNRAVGVFTLPFGIEAELDTSASSAGGPPLLPPRFTAMRPQFTGQLGARQLAISAGNLPATNAAMPGSALANAYGLTVLGGGVDGAGTFFNEQFATGGVEPRVPVWRYDLCGYGASLFSNWVPGSGDPAIGISNARFDVSVGRTVYEVVQAKSYIYPWAIPVVETVTMQRQNDGSVTRIATGWRAYAPGTFDFGLDKASKPNVPAAQIQRGPFVGLFNVRNIDGTGQTISVPNGADPAHPFRYEKVHFDADLRLDDTALGPHGVKLVSGQDGSGRFASRGMVGWLQVSVGALSSIVELEQLLDKAGAATGPIAGMIDIGHNGTLMALSEVDADISLFAAAGPSVVAAVRGAPQLPRDGSWSVSKRSGTLPPAALGAQAPVPLVRPNGTTAWQMAEPSEVGGPANTFYGLLQSTGTQKSLYESPLVAPGGSGYAFPQVPKLADVGALLGLADLFPELGSALTPPSFGGLDVSGDGLKTTISWTIGGQPGDAALIHPGRKLLDFGPVQVYLSFCADPTVNPPPASGSQVTLVIDPTAGASANGRWSFSIQGLNAYVLVAGASSAFDPLLWIGGDFFASEKSVPGFANLNVKFGSAMSVVNSILTALSDVAASLPGGSSTALTVKFAGSSLSITEGFTLPTLPLGFGQISNVGMNLGSAIDLLRKQLNFQVGIGSPQAPVTWSFFPLAGNGCVVVAANQNGLGVVIQAGLGLGLTINVAVASGSASIIFAVQVDTTGATFDIKAMLTGNAQVDVLGGLASASLTLTAGLDIQPLGGGDFDLTAEVAVAIHISICWVISVDFDGSWSMSEELSA